MRSVGRAKPHARSYIDRTRRDHFVVARRLNHNGHLTRYACAESTLEEYQAAFDLRSDYSVVAPAYAARRSDLSKALGLGRKLNAGLQLHFGAPVSRKADVIGVEDEQQLYKGVLDGFQTLSR